MRGHARGTHGWPTFTRAIDSSLFTASGNMVPATAGERVTEYVQIRGSDATIAQAIERQGPKDGDSGERAVLFRYSLAAAEAAGLGFLGDDLRRATPELRIARVVSVGPTWAAPARRA